MRAMIKPQKVAELEELCIEGLRVLEEVEGNATVQYQILSGYRQGLFVGQRYGKPQVKQRAIQAHVAKDGTAHRWEYYGEWLAYVENYGFTATPDGRVV